VANLIQKNEFWPQPAQYEDLDLADSFYISELVTNLAYAAFLNAVAFHNIIQSLVFDEKMDIACMTQVDGSLFYAPYPGQDHHPIRFVNMHQAMLFVNWLENGQPYGFNTAQELYEALFHGTYRIQGEFLSRSNNLRQKNWRYAVCNHYERSILDETTVDLDEWLDDCILAKNMYPCRFVFARIGNFDATDFIRPDGSKHATGISPFYESIYAQKRFNIRPTGDIYQGKRGFEDVGFRIVQRVIQKITSPYPIHDEL